MHIRIPHGLRQAARRWRHSRAIRSGRFGDVNDPLFQRLNEWVKDGDWVIDVGAAVGDYSIALSALVGPRGRVIALEPMPQQFEILVTNSNHAPYPNITCMQVAAGATTDVRCMAAPAGVHGLNWYEASIVDGEGTPVLCTAIDDLPICGRVTFMKVDTEGYDLAALQGAARLIATAHPALLVESSDPRLAEWLRDQGYRHQIAAPPSPNRVHIL